MITAKKFRIFSHIFSAYCLRLVHTSFNRVMIAGEEQLTRCAPGVPTLFLANHSSWWDALLPLYLSVDRWKLDTYAMMDEEQLEKYFFFRWLGTFSVDRQHPREAMRSIDYAAGLLRGTSRALWVYPQGELLPNDTRPLAFFSGVEHIAKRTGPMNLVPIAFRFEFLHERRPDIFIRIGEPVFYNGTDYRAPRSLTRVLSGRLTAELDLLRSSVVAGDHREFKSVVRGGWPASRTFASIMKR